MQQFLFSAFHLQVGNWLWDSSIQWVSVFLTTYLDITCIQSVSSGKFVKGRLGIKRQNTDNEKMAYQSIPKLKSFMFREKKIVGIKLQRRMTPLWTKNINFKILNAVGFRNINGFKVKVYIPFFHTTLTNACIDPWIEIFVQTRNCALKMCVCFKSVWLLTPINCWLSKKETHLFLFYLYAWKKNWRISALGVYFFSDLQLSLLDYW